MFKDSNINFFCYYVFYRRVWVVVSLSLFVSFFRKRKINVIVLWEFRRVLNLFVVGVKRVLEKVF